MIRSPFLLRTDFNSSSILTSSSRLFGNVKRTKISISLFSVSSPRAYEPNSAILSALCFFRTEMILSKTDLFSLYSFMICINPHLLFMNYVHASFTAYIVFIFYNKCIHAVLHHHAASIYHKAHLPEYPVMTFFYSIIQRETYSIQTCSLVCLCRSLLSPHQS